jgi:hypothetical protein
MNTHTAAEQSQPTMTDKDRIAAWKGMYENAVRLRAEDNKRNRKAEAKNFEKINDLTKKLQQKQLQLERYKAYFHTINTVTDNLKKDIVNG